jgi:chaperone required for assembly of F1-ATPase
MRDIFTEIFASEPVDPIDAARRSLRPKKLRARFYERAHVGDAPAEGTESYAVLLDGKPIRTPVRELLAAPSKQLAQAIADEWQEQRDLIDPARMPLTRLANSIIDGVVPRREPVAAEIEKYLGSDLVFYRASEPEGLVANQARHWDPVIAWAREELGARFLLIEGLSFVAQPPEAVAAAMQAVPRDAWRLGAVNAATSMTGSALIALALAHGRLDVEAAWSAAHVDEDWNIEKWGRDEQELERRAFRVAEMQAAARVLSVLK